MAFESLQGKSKRSLARMTGFYLSVLAFVFFWLLAFNFQLWAVFVGWFDPELSSTVHFVHNIGLASFVWIWGLAMLAQLYRPAKRVTTMQVAVLLVLADAGVSVVAGVATVESLLFFGPTLIAAALHPARGEVFGFARLSREDIDPVVLAVAALAVVPVGLYVLGQLTLQATLADSHVALTHYSTMGYFSVSMVVLALLAAVRTRGHRFPAYAAAVMALGLAAASVFYPTASGLDTLWSGLATAWALALVGAYELASRRALSEAAATAPEEPTATSGRGY
jgi:hypothetical protein